MNAFATLNHSPFIVPDGPDLLEQVRAALDAGFSQVEVDIFSVHASIERNGAPEVAAALREVSVLGLAGLNVHDDADRTGAEIEGVLWAVDVTHPQWLLARITGELDRGAELLREYLPRMRREGVRSALEPSPFTNVRSYSDAFRALEGTGEHGVVVDSWHFFASDCDWAALETLTVDDVAYVQLEDAVPFSDDLQGDTFNRRALPGEGVMDVERFTRTLRANGYTGPWSAEVMNAQWRARPVADFARAAFDSLRPY